MINKIIKNAAIGLFSIILGINIIQPVSASIFAKCSNYINIRRQPQIQSPIVGYIYNNNIAEILEEDDYGWIKIKSGEVTGWVAKQYFVQNISNFQNESTYTVAIIHPKSLPVYVSPDKNSIIYTTVYQGQQIECVNYEGNWLTLAFDNGFFGFIDAYQAELKTYYGTAKKVNCFYQINNYQSSQTNNYNQVSNISQDINYYNTYDVYYQSEYIENEQTFYQPPQQESYIYQQSEYIQQEEEQFLQYEEYIQTEYKEEFVEDQIEYIEKYPEYIEDQIKYIEDQYEDDIILEEQYNQYEDSSNNDIVNYADQYLGNPYSYGGNSLTDGIDCSHFVWQVLSNTGHYDGDYAVSDDWANLGEQVDSLDEAVAGDVIVYPGHVAIYDGQGGIVEAKGSDYGITHDRDAEHGTIVAIRHFD